jgi:hypothetical protein
MRPFGYDRRTPAHPFDQTRPAQSQKETIHALSLRGCTSILIILFILFLLTSGGL